MDTLIPSKYKQYGDYINSFRSLPLDIDGLKPVERRILLSAYLVARDKLTKCPRVDGTCVARFHPHSSPYGTLVQMVNQGFLLGQGNFGNNLGVDPSPPAAMRYTECMMKPETVNMMFRLIKHVPWIESESKDDQEPQYLPTMFPVCLMGRDYTQGIGFGYRTFMPAYAIQDLYKRLLWLLGIRKTKPTIKPISNCIINATDVEFEQLLTTGKASLKLKGILKPQKAFCKVAVKSWPPGRKFESILNKKPLQQLLDNQDIGFVDSSNDANGTEIVFTVLKQRNRDKIFNKCVKEIQAAVSGSVAFEMIVTNINAQTRLVSVDEMLLSTFEKYKEANTTGLNFEIAKCVAQILEYECLEKIKQPLAECLKTGSLTKENLPEKIGYISKQSNVSTKIVKHLLTEYRIQRLFTINTDVTSLKVRRIELENNLENIHSYTVDQYKGVK
ncbi:hypothetical protein KAR91_62740 [Candidatus Pacearchaeota archaeon]|nr:hypothetical protein [Candidatus Pacearchaeota archaeon]